MSVKRASSISIGPGKTKFFLNFFQKYSFKNHPTISVVNVDFVCVWTVTTIALVASSECGLILQPKETN